MKVFLLAGLLQASFLLFQSANNKFLERGSA